jgi:deoxyribose-phosphate aldolase
MNPRTLTQPQLAKMIDHSLLHPQITDQDVDEGCALARRYNVASVCVKPCHVVLAKSLLVGSDLAVGVVIGFPHGGATMASKVFEAREAIECGATELDMVINIGKLRSGAVDYVQEEIWQIVSAAQDCLVKVILENAYLDHDQKVAVCQAAEAAGADFVKTSTGYAPTGSTVEDIQLMRATVTSKVQIKAAGGIRTLEAFYAAVDAGATRVGATATAAILDAFSVKGL